VGGKRAMAAAAALLVALALTGCGRITVVGSALTRGPSGTPSRPLPGATVEAVATSSGAIVARVRTAPDGGFLLELERGFYTVVLLPPAGGVGPSERVVAGVGRYAPAIDRHLHLVLVFR
jgi:hypothetical protein